MLATLANPVRMDPLHRADEPRHGAWVWERGIAAGEQAGCRGTCMGGVAVRMPRMLRSSWALDSEAGSRPARPDCRGAWCPGASAPLGLSSCCCQGGLPVHARLKC